MSIKLETFVLNTLKPGIEISVNDLIEKIRPKFPELKENTLQVYISRLKKSGLISNPSRGFYSSKSKPSFLPTVSKGCKSIYIRIKKEFPYINLCVWDTNLLNDLMIHQVFKTYKIVEVEKDAVNQVFQFLNQLIPNVYLNPSIQVFQNYINPNSNHITIVKTLKSEAPLNKSENIQIPTIEKILVDIISEIEIFAAQQDEIENIFKTAFLSFEVNIQSLKRYSTRRNRKEEIKKRINQALA